MGGKDGKGEKEEGKKGRGKCGGRNVFLRIRLPLCLCFFAILCGKCKKAFAETKAGIGKIGTEMQEDDTDVRTVCKTEEPKHAEKEIPVLYTDDLSLLETMGQADCSYAYRDGKVYYRQYHEDSFEEGGLWAHYDPVEDTDKEMVCIDEQGNKSVLFLDRGYGNFYLVGDRFFMTDRVSLESSGYFDRIYSVDMRGQNRVDYGSGRIVAFDRDRNILILNMYAKDNWSGTYAVLNCMDNETIPLIIGSFDSLNFHTYQDGWCYFTAYKAEGTADGVGRVFAVSLEGEQKEILKLVSDCETLKANGYREYICQMGIAGDRLYIVFGGYAGSGGFYQGGELITVKLDGGETELLYSY